MLKDASKEISIPLSILINSSLIKGVFPSIEKIEKVMLIYKSEERSSLDNCRPISVLNVLSKILENAASKQIMEYLESNSLIYKHQYGFRKKKGTQDAVLYLHDYVRQSMDKKKITGALFIDLCKAFDFVRHSCLLSKLPYYGISGIEQ